MFLSHWDLDTLSGNHAFDCIYMDSFPTMIRESCVLLYEKDCDVFNLIDQFFSGHLFRCLNRGASPIILNMSPRQLVRDFYITDKPVELKANNKGKTEDIDWIDVEVVRWAGENLAFLFWRYNPVMEDFLKILSFKDICIKFYPLHESGIMTAARKLWEIYATVRGLPLYE